MMIFTNYPGGASTPKVTEFSQQVNEMLGSSEAVKGGGFTTIVAALHALMQMPSLLQAMCLAKSKEDHLLFEKLMVAQDELSDGIAMGLLDSLSESDAREALTLAIGICERQRQLKESV